MEKKNIDEVRLTPDEYIRDHWIKKKIYESCGEQHHISRYKECLVNVSGKSVLDYGCATGHAIKIMDDLSKNKYEWTGVDLSYIATGAAKKFFPQYVFYPALSEYEIGASTNMFDSVICTEVIEHVEFPRKLVKEVCRVGRYKAIFTTPINIIKDPTHMVVFRRLGLEKIFDSCGYEYMIYRHEYSQNNKHYVIVVYLDRKIYGKD